MKELWTQDESEFPRALLRFPAGLLLPKAEAGAAPRRSCWAVTSRRCSGASSSTADGWVPIDITPEERRRGQADARRPWRKEAGRDPRSIEITAFRRAGPTGR